MDVCEASMSMMVVVLKLVVVSTLIFCVCKSMASGSGGRRQRGLFFEARSVTLMTDGLDTPDAKCQLGQSSDVFRPSERRKSLPGIKYSVKVSDCYDMNNTKRGQAIIINNKHFDQRLEMGTRKGTEIDAQNLDAMLTEMGFESSIKDDCTAKNMTDIISEVAKQNHADEDCFVLVILTHGDHGIVHATDNMVDVDELLRTLKKRPSLAGKVHATDNMVDVDELLTALKKRPSLAGKVYATDDLVDVDELLTALKKRLSLAGKVYATDNRVDIDELLRTLKERPSLAGKVYATDDLVDVDELLTPLKKCPSLAGKPKIVIIQACRGEKLDEGTDVVDARMGAEGDDEMDPVVYRVPVEADFLMAFACVPGYYAWRNEEQGSWFVQALVDVLRENWDRMDLLTIMTRVCKKVALDFESTKTSSQTFLHKKQVPCISSMLTRDVYFAPMTQQ